LLFNDNVSTLEVMALNEMGELEVKDLEGGGRDLFYGTIQAFVCNLGQKRNTSVRMPCDTTAM
jgi:hypothetical protein